MFKFVLLSLFLFSSCSTFKKVQQKVQGPPHKPSFEEEVFYFQRNSLSFQKSKKSQLKFRIDNTNPINGDSCELEGLAKPITVDSEYEWKATDSTCKMSFHFAPKSVEMTYTEDCHAYCGMRSSLPEVFYEESEHCDAEELKVKKKKVRDILNKGSYILAASAYSKILAVCENFMELTEVNSMLNDKAHALWKANDSSGCRKTLKPIKHWAGRDDDKGQSELPHVHKLRNAINYTWKMCNIEKCGPRSILCEDG